VRPANAFFLFRVRLRSRAIQELLAVTGIAVGVGLIFAALVASTSMTGSVRQLNDSVVGNATLQLAQRGTGGFDESIVDDVRRIDGVETAAPMIDAQANVLGPNGRESVLLVGGDSAFTRLDGKLLRHVGDNDFGVSNTIGLPAPLADTIGLAFAQDLRIEINSRIVRAKLGARLDAAEIGPLVHHPVAIAGLPVAQRISGMDGRITRVLIETEPGRDRDVAVALRRLAGDRLAVTSADAEVDVFARAAYPSNQATALFSFIAALVGFLFAFSAVLLTVPQRRRFITDIRMAGHSSSAVFQLLLLDALALGAAGAILGLLIGDQLSRHLFDTTPVDLAAAFAIGSQRIVTWRSAGIAGCAGLGAACVAVFLPLRDTLVYRPNRRRRHSAARDRRFDILAAIAGLACLGLVTVLVATASSAAVPAIATLTVALLLMLPLLLRLMTLCLARTTRSIRSVVPTIALQELGSSDAKARTLALAATGAIAVFATVAVGGAHADLVRGLDAAGRDVDQNADIWITFDGKTSILATTPFDEPRQIAARIRRFPEIRTARPYHGGFLDIGDRRAWIVAPPQTAAHPIPPTQVIDGDPDMANRRMRDGGWIALSRALADDLDAKLGDRVRLPSAVPSTFRVAAITTNLGWAPGAIVLNARDYARAWDSHAATAIHVDVRPGASANRVVSMIEQAIGPDSPMRVETARERVQRHRDMVREGLAPAIQISALVLISAVLAMACTMGGMIWQRRRTFAALKVQGFSERELWSALLVESTILLGTASLAGAVLGLYGQVLMSRALESITGFPVLYSVGLLIAAGILGIATLVAVAMLAIPGWLAVRVRPQRGLAR
jgi:putative ABC transport system permease protein